MSTNKVVVARNSKVMLNNKNYTLWFIPMEAKLYKIEALTIVTGARRTRKILISIPEVLAYVSSLLPTADKFDGYKLWQILKAKFAGDDVTSKHTALKKFLTFKYKSFATFLPQIKSAHQKIVLWCLALDDQVKTILMLDKLPQEFHSFKTNISMNFESCPFDQALKKLEDFASQNQLINNKRTTEPMQTFYTQSINQEVTCPHCKRGFYACSHCLKRGHSEENCYYASPENCPGVHSRISGV
ncbi:hypothetical protein VP01_4732g2 [Puccinia sorghi]|uniref:Uncharacterized protein n=1 Tax=Puccinia sorghi TaxID=27349 RepID=A0A0L6UPX7_9BASI|nr:hypothetical protein VP01_4732g2 [Puccinia sorghi]